MRSHCVTRAALGCVLVGWMCCPVGSGAHALPLSFPVVLPEGPGLVSWLGPAASPLQGPWWYGWQQGAEPSLCPSGACTPPPGVDTWRVYPSDSAHWRAGLSTGTPGQWVDVSEVDWDDALESTTASTASRVRVGVTLYTALAEPLPAYELVRLPGTADAWGVRADDREPAHPVSYDSGDATVLTPCARLTVQKLVASDAPARPGEGRWRWNAHAGEWTGTAATLVNTALWEHPEGRVGLLVAVDEGGKARLRYDWEPGRAVLPAHVTAAGWYRLTLSLDGSVAGARRCGATPLSTSLTEAEVEAGAPYAAVVDAVWNLTWLDVYVRPAE